MLVRNSRSRPLEPTDSRLGSSFSMDSINVLYRVPDRHHITDQMDGICSEDLDGYPDISRTAQRYYAVREIDRGRVLGHQK